MQTLCVLKGFHRRAVSLLRFSKNGKLLATVGHDTHHRYAIHSCTVLTAPRRHTPQVRHTFMHISAYSAQATHTTGTHHQSEEGLTCLLICVWCVSLAVYDWENQVMVCHCSTTPSKPLALDFTLDNSGLILAGQGFIKYVPTQEEKERMAHLYQNRQAQQRGGEWTHLYRSRKS